MIKPDVTALLRSDAVVVLTLQQASALSDPAPALDPYRTEAWQKKEETSNGDSHDRNSSQIFENEVATKVKFLSGSFVSPTKKMAYWQT